MNIFKVLRSENGILYSITTFPFPPGMIYNPNRAIWRQPGHGPLAAFDTILNAISFWKDNKYPEDKSDIQIWRATGNQSKDSALWYPVDNIRVEKFRLDLPKGTILCDWIRLEERIQ